MQERHQVFFMEVAEPRVEYEVHVLDQDVHLDFHWVAVDASDDREDLMKKINDPNWEYFSYSRRIVAIHHKVEVIDWLDGGKQFTTPAG